MSSIKNRYRFLRRIGEGAFSKVYEVESRDKSELNLAAKAYTNENGAFFRPISEAASICREISILRLFQGPVGIKHGIIQLLDVQYEYPEICIIMPKYTYTLYHAIVNGMLNISEKNHIMKGIIDSIVFLHDNEIMHRDIKPANVMLTSDKKPILIDFTISKWFSEKMDPTCHTPVVVSVPYRPPEIVDRRDYDFSIDTYATGVMFFEMFSEIILEYSEDERECMIQAKREINRAKRVPYLNIIKQMTQTNPRKRIPLRRVYKHIWKSWLPTEKVWEQQISKLTPNKITHGYTECSNVALCATEIYIEKTGRDYDDTFEPSLYFYDNIATEDLTDKMMFDLLDDLWYNYYI